MAKQLSVLVLGYGEMGHAMEFLLKDGFQLGIWDKFPQDDFHSVKLEDAAQVADVVLFCLPVNPHREIAEGLVPLLKPACICISIAKGLDEAGQTASQIFSDVFLSQQPYGLLYGPMISEEIRAGRSAFAQVGCDADSFNTISGLFAETSLYLTRTSDIIGISWSVILKNVYALIFGMSDELKLGDNMRGYLAVAALRELDKIVCGMGGQAGSPYHLAGLGDLITTATSEDSHHHELGRMLARGETNGIVGEGVHTLSMVKQHQLFDTTNYPLFCLIDSIVEQPSDVHKSIAEYLDENC
jgi:glycerol-3-phosphate dehydrogenase (NAD(P)+)